MNEQVSINNNKTEVRYTVDADAAELMMSILSPSLPCTPTALPSTMQKNADFIHAICCHCNLLNDDYKNEMLEMSRTNERANEQREL